MSDHLEEIVSIARGIFTKEELTLIVGTTLGGKLDRPVFRRLDRDLNKPPLDSVSGGRGHGRYKVQDRPSFGRFNTVINTST